MNASGARVQMRPAGGGSRAYTRALVALAGALALLGACSQDDPDHGADSNGTSAGSPGASNAPSVAPPSATAGNASGEPAMSTGATDPRTAADAGGDRFPHCADSVDDEDGGISPYLDACAIDERFGVFVNPTIGPDAQADGSRARPFGTLLHAVAAAVNAGKHVFACEGTYEEPLRIGTALANGLHVYGGLSCDTFSLASADARSRVHATTDGAALTIADTRDVVIERFELEDAPAAAPKPGSTYVGAFIHDARGVVLRDVLLRASSGERGADGAPPASEAAGDGVMGEDGGDACSATPNAGGAVVTSPGCRTQQTATSGSGGGGGEGTGPGGSGTWYGLAQIPGEDTADWACVQGKGAPYPPNPGYAGQPGSGGRGFGALLGTGFIGFGGQNGADGVAGGGGGGGGGAKAPASCPGGGTAVGASGGGGGSGGCGGKGGEGGGAGGSSIGLLLVNAHVTMERGEIAYGDGGDGGNGARGQKGGKGAPGGHGGKGVSGSKAACDGAAGSNGGDGGDGGGGNGGHAIGVMYAGGAPTLVDVLGEDAAAMHHGGKPGSGPVAENMVGVGTAGEAAFAFAF